MRFGTHKRIWMSYRSLDSISLNGRMVSSASGQSSELECLRAQVLPRMPFAVDDHVCRQSGGVRVRQVQLERSLRETEDFWWPSLPLGCESLLNIRNSKAARPVVTWPTGQSVNTVDVDWSGSAPGAFKVMKSWDQAGRELQASFLPMYHRIAAGYSLEGDSSDSKIARLERLSCQTGANAATAGVFMPLDPFLRSADHSIQMPGLQEAGMPMEASSVKRKRKKKMNKHKQRKLRRRDRHRK